MAFRLAYLRRSGAVVLPSPKEGYTMKLEEALLCVECESLYAVSSHCPQCGSRVSYPISRALNRRAPSADVLAMSPSPAVVQTRARSSVAAAVPALKLLRSA